MATLPPAAYDDIAAWYDEMIRSGRMGIEASLDVLVHMAGPVTNLTICDLACGQGIIARAFARNGARVTGVDLSARLLALAQAEEDTTPLGITYLRDDVQTGLALPEAAFDGVTCYMALMDIPDLGATLTTVRRILRPSGWFAFAITHPCMQMPGAYWDRREDGSVVRILGDYYSEGFWRSDPRSPGVRAKIGAQHRTLSTYVNSLLAAHFAIDHIEEPRPILSPEERARLESDPSQGPVVLMGPEAIGPAVPSWVVYQRVPMILAVRCHAV